MTKGGYYGLVAVFALFLIIGLFLAGPSRLELGLASTSTCDAWLRSPEAELGAIRLTDCTLDARSATHGTSSASAVLIPFDGGGGSTSFASWETEDPEWVWLVRSFRRFDPSAEWDIGSRERFVERHEDEMVRTRQTIEGNATRRGEMIVVDEVPDRSIQRPLGIVLFTIGAIALALLVFLQRRWTERRSLLRGAAKPVAF